MDSSTVVLVSNIIVAWLTGWFHAMPSVPDPLVRAVTVLACGALYWYAAGAPHNVSWALFVNIILFIQSVKGTQSDIQGTAVLPAPNTFKAASS